MDRVRFRPELEGLRGLAVLLVVGAHAGLPIPGAAIGPDLFFVLSGYLIVGLLLRRLAVGGQIDLAAFYARRLRRLLPAALVAIAITVGAVALLDDPFALERVALDGIAALTGTANIRYPLVALDYFAPVEPSPFLPLWSLGVEEQFCLLAPLLVGLAYRIGRRRGVAILVGTVALTSAVAAIIVSPLEPIWSYYLLPTRAYALALGGLLVVGESVLERRAVRALPLGWLGLAGLVALLALVPLESGYPGLAGPLAALAAAALIGGAQATVAAGGVLIRLLSIPPLRGLGRISYSLFLLHFPFLVVPPMYGIEMGLPETLSALAVLLLSSLLLYRLVERPFRDGLLIGERPGQILPRVGAIAASGLLVLGAIGLRPVAASSAPPVAIATPVPTVTPTPSPISSPSVPTTPLPWAAFAIDGTDTLLLSGPLPAGLRPTLERSAYDADDVISSGCGYTDRGTSATSCSYGTPGGPRIAIVGTSHAAHWVPALAAIAATTGWEINPYVKTNCPFVDYEVDSTRLGRAFTECTSWRENVIVELNARPPVLVIIASARHVDPSGRVDTLEKAADAVGAMTSRLVAPVAIFADLPFSETNIPSCLARHRDEISPCAIARSETTYAWATKRDLRVGEKFGLPTFDFTPSICPGSRCAPVIDGIVLYHDHHHLTVTMSRHLAPALAEQLVPLVESLLPPRPERLPHAGPGGV